MPGDQRETTRQRKGHHKSRWGCRNCKLRRVKCDENRPDCSRCKAFGVSCNYLLKAPDLQPLEDGTTKGSHQLALPRRVDKGALQITESLAYAMPPIKSNPIFVVTSESTSFCNKLALERLRRFQMRTILGLWNSEVSQSRQNATIRLALTHAYVMHVVQTLTAMHDRYFSDPNSSQQVAPLESYHWYKGASTFNQRLSAPIKDQDRDAIWATAGMLGVIVFNSIEASTPEEAWPLRPPSPSDLEWIQMIEGKTTIWKIVNPLPADSIFRKDVGIARTITQLPPTLDSKETELPSGFTQLYNISNISSNIDTTNNPYHAAVWTLAPLLHIKCTPATLGSFFVWINSLQPCFKRLLRQKDPRAMLLLAYWYAHINGSQWWVTRRATLECQAICLYLERYHHTTTDDEIIHILLQGPKKSCGLI